MQEAGPACHRPHPGAGSSLPPQGYLNIVHTELQPQHHLPEVSECLSIESCLGASRRGSASPPPGP